ncbi:hypothetical protein NM04_14845 [Massilia aurea]|uniref:Uncharacterized protein n=1 Tax=Massilia aurea TaxID=373040 RepID=A0A422QJ82_9BURK|nr:hypothetical protein [Massilia aurea]RNF30020.1 hypothetical protein NM04_14845 [Massilia aurea]
MSDFEVVGPITNIETIAEGSGIRCLVRLKKFYSGKNWKKKKGQALIREQGCAPALAEIHWYEAHGIGKVEMKIKEYL